MRVIHSEVKREKPPSKRPRITSSKQICLCMAIGFAALYCHNAISRKHMLTFVKKGPNHKILAHCVKKPIFNAILLHVGSS